MAATEPQLSGGYRWKLGTTLFFLILSIPLAALGGSMIGSQLMGNLREQLVIPASGADPQAEPIPAFSPYGIAHSSQSAPGKSVWSGSGEDSAEEAERTATENDEAQPNKVLEAAPVITVEPIIVAQDPIAEAQADPSSAEPTQSSDPNSIFNLDENRPKRSKQYRIVLGTFGNQENAAALVQDLLSHGYEPFIEAKEPAEGSTTPQFRVLIGTFNDAADAGSVAEELRRLGYNAWLNEKL